MSVRLGAIEDGIAGSHDLFLTHGTVIVSLGPLITPFID